MNCSVMLYCETKVFHGLEKITVAKKKEKKVADKCFTSA